MKEALSVSEVKAFYDRFGTKQDSQSFYEERAIDDLVAHAALGSARHVFEVGCGTGRVAEQLLSRNLPADATYEGVDLSSTMIDISYSRLLRFGERARVRRIDGSNPFSGMSRRPDRIVTTYVLDVLPTEDIASFVDCSARVLEQDGRLCIASLTYGRTPLPALVSAAWLGVFRLAPAIVGGCRPIRLLPFFSSAEWDVMHHRVLSSWGVASEIVVARKLGE